jgi:hypothetical protein
VYIRALAISALSLVMFAAPSRAASCVTDGTTCTNTVSPADTTAIFDFQQAGNGILIVQFDTVLTTFDLTVTLNTTFHPLDPNEFPAGTICVPYTGTGGGLKNSLGLLRGMIYLGGKTSRTRRPDDRVNA